MDEVPSPTRWLSVLLLLATLAVLSGGIVWAGNVGGLPGAAFAVLGLGMLGVLVAGIAGVPTLSTILVMATLTGFFEGIVWGRDLYGWPGAILGGLVGIAVAPAVGMTPIALGFFLVYLFDPGAFDPVDAVAEGGQGTPQAPASRRRNRTIGRLMAWILAVGLLLGLLAHLHAHWSRGWTKGLVVLSLCALGCFAQARCLKVLEDESSGWSKKVAILVGMLALVMAGCVSILGVASLVFKIDRF